MQRTSSDTTATKIFRIVITMYNEALKRDPKRQEDDTTPFHT